MEKRKHTVYLWLNDEEFERLERISADHCMRRGDVLRTMITGTELLKPPDEDFREIRRSLDRIESEAEILAYTAAREGFCAAGGTEAGLDAFERYLTKLEEILSCLEEIRDAVPERK